MGTPAFAATILEGLVGDGWDVVGVVTQPDRRRGRGRKLSLAAVKQVALERGITVLQPGSIRDSDLLPALKAMFL